MNILNFTNTYAGQVNHVPSASAQLRFAMVMKVSMPYNIDSVNLTCSKHHKYAVAHNNKKK